MLHKTIRLLVVSALLTSGALAAKDRSVERVTRAEQETVEAAGQQGETLNEAVSRIEQQMGGEVLSAEQVHHRGSLMYRIKLLLPQGRIKIVNVYPSQGSAR